MTLGLLSICCLESDRIASLLPLIVVSITFMMWFFMFIVVLLDLNFRAAAVERDAISSLRRDEFERRDKPEKCPDTAQQLNKLIAEFENIGGELKEATATMNQMASRTEKLTRDLQLHDERLRLHDHHLKKFTDKGEPQNLVDIFKLIIHV